MYVAQVGLEKTLNFPILMLLPFLCEDFRYALLFLCYTVQRMKPRVSCVVGKHSCEPNPSPKVPLPLGVFSL